MKRRVREEQNVTKEPLNVWAEALEGDINQPDQAAVICKSINGIRKCFKEKKQKRRSEKPEQREAAKEWK